MVRALDIFCGGGGSSYGAQLAGVEVVAGIDRWDLAMEVFSRNFPSAQTYNRLLETIRFKKLTNEIGKIDLLLASPECTNHTCAKGSAPRSEASRATALQVLRFARSLRPRWIVMENVIHMRPWSRYEELKESLSAIGYNVREQILDSSDFGVPQSRRRLFVMCDIERQPPEVRKPRRKTRTEAVTILDPDGLWPTTPLYRKGRAPDTIARAERAIASLGRAEKFLIVYYGTDGSGGWQPLTRPLRTVTTVDRFALVVPHKNGPTMRMLQVSELRRAMGFDDNYKLEIGTRRERIHVLGNGVCPPVMKAVVHSLTSDG
ncbi:MAG: DNA cytosine methyltransferase [Nitratireductor sp.]